MKLKFRILSLLLAVTTSLSAQQYAEDYNISKSVKGYHKVEMVYGVIAGVIIPSMSEKSDKMEITSRAGYGFGMVWGVDLGGIKILPEFWYMHDKSLLDLDNDSEDYTIVSNSVEVPVIFSLPIGSRLSFNVGPSFSLMSDTKIKMDDDDDIDFGRTKSTAGYLIGLNLILHKHIVLDWRYTGRFVSVKNEWYTGSESYDYRYSNFSFNLGYRF